MSVQILSESYNSLSSLQANGGDWVDGVVRFYSRFDIVSSISNTIEYNHIAGDTTLSLSSGSWDQYGFKSGMSINISWTWSYNSGGTDYVCSQTDTVLITYINGSIMHIDSVLSHVGCGGTPPPTSIGNGWTFPATQATGSASGVSAMTIYSQNGPEQMDFTFNLSEAGSNALDSLIDGERNVFTNPSIGSMVPLDTVTLNQIAIKSGGYISNVELTLESIDADFYHIYRVDFVFVQWAIIQSGFSEPNYLNGTNHVAPTFQISTYSESNNPNTALRVINQNNQANTGGFDENYNGGFNNYSLQSVTYFDNLGNEIDAIDYTNPCTFEAFIDAPNQDTVNSTYNIGLVYRPIDTNTYQNLPLNLARNLLLNVPGTDFGHSTTPDPTIYFGNANSDRARFDLTDIQFFVSGPTVRVTGEIIPSAETSDYFESIPDGGRKLTLWVSIGDYTNDGTPLSERVSLTIHNKDVIDAPIKGVQIPNVLSTAIFDHKGNNTKTGGLPLSRVTTEDDCLYEMSMLLVDNVDYSSMAVNLLAVNNSSFEEFTLERFFFDFDSVPFIGGQFQPNFSINRGFNLPSSTDRNIVSIKRDPSIDIPGKYGIKILYGFLSRWEYWLSQTGVDNFFFDSSEPNDGKNKNWQRYSQPTKWNMRVEVNTVVNDVEDFDYTDFNIRPYDDEDANTTVLITNVNTGLPQTSFTQGEKHTVEATIVWNPGTFTDPWAEATVEDFESGNRWVISSILQRTFSSNPLEPISGETGLKLTFLGDTAKLSFVLDTSKVGSENICMSFRIHDAAEFVEGKRTTEDVVKTDTITNIKTLSTI